MNTIKQENNKLKIAKEEVLMEKNKIAREL